MSNELLKVGAMESAIVEIMQTMGNIRMHLEALDISPPGLGDGSSMNNRILELQAKVKSMNDGDRSRPSSGHGNPGRDDAIKPLEPSVERKRIRSRSRSSKV